MRAFSHEVLPGRVIFGVGGITAVTSELEALGGRRALVIVTPRQVKLAAEVTGLLGDRCVGVHARAVEHVPAETVQEGLEQVQSLQADSLVAVGGGSAIGLAKAIALHTHLPVLAIPTTYSGSEMTAVWGVTEDGRKTTGKNPQVKPKTTIYDPQLTLELPPQVSVASGMNALAHCVEGLYAEHFDPVISLLAQEGMRALGSSLPVLLEEPRDAEARGEALYGAWLAGMVLGSVGMALHHKLCHVIGGRYKLPHALTHAVLLPYVIAYNAPYAPDAARAIVRALDADTDDAAGAVYNLARTLGIPASLAELGMQETELANVADLVTQNPYYNPRPLDSQAILHILSQAYAGVRP